MKKTILATAASVFIAGVILTSCHTAAEKVENAQNNVKEAKKELDSANKEYLADIENYRKETAEKILRLIDMLEDLDDVQHVYSNADIVEEVLIQME